MPLRSVVRSTVGLLAVVLLALGMAPAWGTAPAITVQPTVGPPTTALTVQGSGFGSNESVALAFDDQALASATTDGSGSFTGALTVPPSATPGSHTVNATGATSGLSATTTFLVRTDWAQFRYGPDHSGYNPYENVLSPSNVGLLVQGWYVPTPSGSRSSPAVANGVVYVGSEEGGVYALDAATGAIKWTASGGGYPVESSPAVANGVVYVGSNAGRVYALDAATGAVKWATSTGTDTFVDSSPAVSNAVVYVGYSYDESDNEQGGVYALDAATGAVKWTVGVGSPVQSSPAVANGTVYVGSHNGTLYALDSDTGAVRWTAAPGGDVYSSPAVANGLVYAGSYNSIYALDAATGAMRWTVSTGGFVYSSPAVANGVVYAGSGDGELYALDAVTGAIKWTASAAGVSGPAVANGVVYAAGGGRQALRAGCGHGGGQVDVEHRGLRLLIAGGSQWLGVCGIGVWIGRRSARVPPGPFRRHRRLTRSGHR